MAIPAVVKRLLPQDEKVMSLLLEANTRSEIAEKLNMPIGTVHSCCSRIYKYAGCNNIAGFMIWHQQNQNDGGNLK